MAVTGGRARVLAGGSIESQGGNFFIRRDGTNSPSADIDWAGFNLVGLGDVIPDNDGGQDVGNAGLVFDTGWFRNLRPDAGQDIRILANNGEQVFGAGAAIVINESGADRDFRVESDADANALVVNAGNNRLGMGVGAGTVAAKLHIQQVAIAGGIPVLRLDQKDVSEPMINLDCTIGEGNGIEAVGSKTLTVTHFAQVAIEGVGVRLIQLGTIA